MDTESRFWRNVKKLCCWFFNREQRIHGTGSDGLYLKDFWEWDQATNVWTQKANFGGTARIGAVGFSIGNKGYIGTGMNGNGQPYAFMDLWEYDPNLK